MVRVGIVDDHPLFRVGLRRTLEREPDLLVEWDLGSTVDVKSHLAATPVDVLLMDLNLGPGQDALATTRAVRMRHPRLKVIVISASVDSEAAAAARTAGASGYLPKELPGDEIVAAVKGIAVTKPGRREFKDLLATRVSQTGGWVSRHGLSKREEQVFGELRRGRSNREIASQLHVSVTTVNKHVQQVLRKLQVKTRAQAVARFNAETAGQVYRPNGSSQRPR